MKKGLYIFTYHDVSEYYTIFNKEIGGTITTNNFVKHLKKIKSNFELIGINEAIKRFENNDLDQPYASIWFDDGLIGVRENALNILNDLSVEAAMAINSDTILRKDLMWRFKLSAIIQKGKLPALMSNIQDSSIKKDKIKEYCMDNFSLRLIEIINEIFYSLNLDDIFQNYDTVEGINILKENNWLITNHTKSHYPIGEESAYSMFDKEFEDGFNELANVIDIDERFYVLPFDRSSKQIKNIESDFKCNYNNKYLVLLGNRYNNEHDYVIYRYSLPMYSWINPNRFVVIKNIINLISS